jgi:SAM-dependent methyltransferase
MTAKVLKSRSEIDLARIQLKRQKLSCLTSWPLRAIRRRGLLKGVNVGDHIKSWDVLNTAQFVKENVPLGAPVLDMGAYASEILCVLHGLNYSALAGVDLNPKVNQMPYAHSIRYEISDFMRTPFPDQSFAAITAISVIEHGFEGRKLFREVSRLLRPGGYFIASFDYWPDKIDTVGIKIFGMDWRIFSQAEVVDMIKQAEESGLALAGELELDALEQTIETCARKYTFAWLVLQKRLAPSSPSYV